MPAKKKVTKEGETNELALSKEEVQQLIDSSAARSFKRLRRALDGYYGFGPIVTALYDEIRKLEKPDGGDK